MMTKKHVATDKRKIKKKFANKMLNVTRIHVTATVIIHRANKCQWTSLRRKSFIMRIVEYVAR